MYEFEMQVGEIKRFSEGRGVLMSIKDEENEFLNLRKLILNNGGSIPREHEPHITIMHPRNSTCNDEIFEEVKKVKWPEKISIKRVSLIEQEIGKKWRVLKEYELKNKHKN